jgi:hypothetical protein
MKQSRCVLTICLLAFLIVTPGAASRISTSIEGHEDSGVQVVRNKRKPIRIPGSPTRLLLVEELMVGRGADDNSRFSELRSAQADSEGCIYALDGKDCQIKVFDSAGHFLRTIGKKGQGPGEFSTPSRIILTPTDEVVAFDAGNRRLSFFKKDGALIKELSTARWNFLRFRVSKQGDIYADHAIFSEQGKVVLQMTKFSPDLTSSTVLATESRAIAPNHIDPFASGFQHGVTHDGGLAWVVDSRYEITVVDPNGKVRLKIFKDPEPNPIGEQARKKIIKEDYQRLPAGITVDFPSHFPPIRTLVVTDTDYVIIRTYVKDKQGRYNNDVFDPKGRFIAQFPLAEEEFVMMARDGKLYTLVREDAEGIPLIKRYGLVWK